jgi:hypothetical protein
VAVKNTDRVRYHIYTSLQSWTPRYVYIFSIRPNNSSDWQWRKIEGAIVKIFETFLLVLLQNHDFMPHCARWPLVDLRRVILRIIDLDVAGRLCKEMRVGQDISVVPCSMSCLEFPYVKMSTKLLEMPNSSGSFWLTPAGFGAHRREPTLDKH